MDVTKDNLKQFVERWNEHPNSPYIFEISNHTISPSMLPTGGESLSGSSQSLIGESPSPCGSLASSPGSDNAFMPVDQETYHHLLPAPVDHFRRASDSTCVMKSNDIAERNNLAEEIRKLSDKLFQLSNFNTNLTNSESPFKSEISQAKEETVVRSVPITITGTKHKNNFQNETIQNENLGIPWRKTKFKVNNMSRDVPLPVQTIHKSQNSLFTTKTNSINSPNGTKDLLLQLLEQWDGHKGRTRNTMRHGSISTDSENDSLGQKTISSLNSFFQSRATNKLTPLKLDKN